MCVCVYTHTYTYARVRTRILRNDLRTRNFASDIALAQSSRLLIA